MYYRKHLLLIIIITIFLATIGCWDRRELNQLAIATCIGIDQAEDPNKEQITVEVILPQNVPTPGGGGGQGPASYNFQAQGATTFDAARKLTLESEEKIYFAHNPVLIYGEKLAKEGIISSFDFFIRDPEHRRTVWILVAEDKAQNIINIPSILEPIRGLYINKLVEETASNSLVATSNIQDFLERLMSPTTSPYCTLIKEKGEEKEKTVELTGTAIFKKDKMVGKFDYKESRGLLWILGEIKSGIINIPYEKDQVALEIISSTSKIIPSIVDNTLKITIKVNEEGNLGQQQSLVNLTTPVIWKSLEMKKAESIKQEILAAVQKAQELNADVFGFGEAFHRKYPSLWREQLEKNWDEFFTDLEVEILVEAKLRRSGMISNPAVPQ